MVFSSSEFLFCFFPLFFIVYFAFKNRSVRNYMLFAFSLVFYAWGEKIYIILILLSIAINYLLSLKISSLQDKSKNAKPLLIFTIALNLALLGVFKYTGFILEIIGVDKEIRPEIALPIGISFYTFQILAYIIDVYRKKYPVQKNIFFLGAYIAAFPQLVAGPIVRYETIANEIINRKETLEDFAAGSRRFIAGLAKKVLIANNAAFMADGILAMTGNEYGAIGAWIGMIAYSVQIYFDFSGYSDMAIGLGRMMGFHYLENFNYPYIAKSITDFWRRWHISLSGFFRDYVYIPLGGNRVSKMRWVLNTMIIWGLTGLWHGAAWTFIIWGLYYGVLMVIEKMFLQKTILKIPIFCNLYTIFFFIFGWVIFRAENISHIGEIVSSMFGFNGAGSFIRLVELDVIQLPHILMVLTGMVCAAPISKILSKALSAKAVGRLVIDVSVIAVFIYSVFTLAMSSYNPFIYFIF